MDAYLVKLRRDSVKYHCSANQTHSLYDNARLYRRQKICGLSLDCDHNATIYNDHLKRAHPNRNRSFAVVVCLEIEPPPQLVV